MPIRYVIIPKPIALVDPSSKKPLLDAPDKPTAPVTFSDFVGKLLFNPIWAENYKNIKSAKAVERAVDGAEPGTVATLAEEDWKKLRDIVENPKGGYGYHAAVMPQLLPFLDAIMEAEDKKTTIAVKE